MAKIRYTHEVVVIRDDGHSPVAAHENALKRDVAFGKKIEEAIKAALDQTFVHEKEKVTHSLVITKYERANA